MREIPLHSNKYPGMVALVDDADYELVSQYKWSPQKGRNTFYARADSYGVLMHKLITGFVMTDHEDHNGLNNQRYNMRDTNNRRNLANQGKTLKPTSSQYKGVSKVANGNGKWLAGVRANYKWHHIGYFTNECDAATAYNFKAYELFGDDASFNIAA